MRRFTTLYGSWLLFSTPTSPLSAPPPVATASSSETDATVAPGSDAGGAAGGGDGNEWRLYASQLSALTHVVYTLADYAQLRLDAAGASPPLPSSARCATRRG